MAPSVFSALTMGGSAYIAYQAYQDSEQQKMIIFSAVAGLALSLSLQVLSGRFSKEERSFGRVLLEDCTSLLTKFVLPLSVAYGYMKKNGPSIHEWSFGIIHFDPKWTWRSLDMTYLFPVLVGANLGFLGGKIIGHVIVHFSKEKRQN